MATRGDIFAHFADQAEACDALGSPFTAEVCRIAPEVLDQRTAFGARVLGWTGDPFDDALALRVAGALHGLARSGRAPVLRRAWPPYEDGDLAAATGAAIEVHDNWLAPWLDGPPQTNETGRSAILLGGCLEITRRTGMAIEMLEIGSSAGLNLHFDAWRYDLGAAGGWGEEAAPVTVESDWRGRGPDLATLLEVAARAGVDIAPLDPANPEHRARMLAYIWPDQPARLTRAEAALAHVAGTGLKVARGDAAHWVAAKFSATQEAGRVRVLAHTIVWQYLPKSTKGRIRDALTEAGDRATPAAPLAWLRLEPDGGGEGAAIRLTLWPGGRETILGRGDFHGRWAEWDIEP